MFTLEIALRRLFSQRLAGALCDTPEEVVAWLGAVQSQDYVGASWGVGQRAKGCTEEDVGAAYDDGRILRTHVMRPTWHFVARDDIRWLQALTGARVQAGNAGRYRRLEIDAATHLRARRVLERSLRDGRHLTRREVSERLAAGGIAEPAGQRLAHIVMHAELDAVICSGALRGTHHTYALVDERAPAARTLSRDEALAELVGRYFRSHGPALAQDFSWWSGLTMTDARRGLEINGDALISETIDGKTYWSGDAGPHRLKRPVVHLLPNYDEALISYKDYGPIIAPWTGSHPLMLGEAAGGHLVVRDGKVVGVWRRDAGADGARVSVRLITELDAAARNALRAAAHRYGAFSSAKVTLGSE
jgi:hypothetical protein